MLLQLRLPRLLLALLIGAAQGMAGAALQGLLRNPLADPGLLGVSGGAAFAAVLWLALCQPLGLNHYLPSAFALPLAASLGGLLVATLVVALARQAGVTRMATLLLAGIALNALCAAGMALCQQLASDAALRDMVTWLLGSLSRSGWAEIAVAAPVLLLCCLALPRYAGALDALLLGEAAAQQVGVNVEQLRRRIVLWVVLATAASVSLAGMIGFIGLLVPHGIRLLAGPGHRLLLPASALGGACLLALADLAARSLFSPLELPVGALTALAGAPLFLWLLSHSRGRAGLD